MENKTDDKENQAWKEHEAWLAAERNRYEEEDANRKEWKEYKAKKILLRKKEVEKALDKAMLDRDIEQLEKVIAEGEEVEMPSKFLDQPKALLDELYREIDIAWAERKASEEEEEREYNRAKAVYLEWENEKIGDICVICRNNSNPVDNAGNPLTDEDNIPLGPLNAKCNCQHVFHTSCLTKWRRINNTCPTCRQKCDLFFDVPGQGWRQRLLTRILHLDCQMQNLAEYVTGPDNPALTAWLITLIRLMTILIPLINIEKFLGTSGILFERFPFITFILLSLIFGDASDEILEQYYPDVYRFFLRYIHSPPQGPLRNFPNILNGIQFRFGDERGRLPFNIQLEDVNVPFGAVLAGCNLSVSAAIAFFRHLFPGLHL